jgi:tetraacyldisaccharide 4'-kinase
MQIIRYLLYPLSLFYGLAVYIRNKCYDIGLLPSRQFDIPVICIGNLEVGGSGKTPFTEYLVQLLQKNISLATLSRGYGRITVGFRWVDALDDVSLCGDEPLQIKQNFPAIGVAVCENRVLAIHRIKDNYDAVIMDDAYQHRAVKAGLSILLFDYNRLNSNKLLLPAGNYRESYASRKRADILIVTKCPENIEATEKVKIIKNIAPFAYQKVLFAGIAYADKLQPVLHGIDTILLNNISAHTTILLITGIAKPGLLLAKLKTISTHIIHHAYADHHTFTLGNVSKLVSQFKAIPTQHKIILTTQKDATRLNNPKFEQQLVGLPLYKVKINMIFANDDKLILENTVLQYVSKY